MTDAPDNKLISELLADSAALAPALPRVPGEPRSTITAAREVRKQWPDVTGRKLEADPERIVAAMHARLRDDHWDDCSWNDVCDAARALCDSKLALWREGRFAPVQDMVFGEVRRAENRLFIETMIRIYIETWDQRSPLTRDLARELSKVWQQAAPDYGRLIEHYRLFDVEQIVGNLLVRMSETPNPFNALREIGIAAPHGPGLMQAVHRSFVDRMRSRLVREDATGRDFETLLDWLHPPDHECMAAGAGIAIAALLEPWEARQPPRDLKALIERRLVESFGDPRVAKAGAWAECERSSLSAY
ncbi:MAG: EH signature domain-containing protein, partial [Nitratireductor sp.]